MRYIGLKTPSRARLAVSLLACGIVASLANAVSIESDDTIRELIVNSTQIEAVDVHQLALPNQDGPAPFVASIPIDGRNLSIQFVPYSWRSPDFQLLVQDQTGELKPFDNVPAPQTYRGRVLGKPDARVVGSLGNTGLSMSLRTGDGSRWNVEPVSNLIPHEAGTLHAVYRSLDVKPRPGACGVNDLQLSELRKPERTSPVPTVPPVEGGIAGSSMMTCKVACDSDVEFFTVSGSDVVSTMQDIEGIMAQVADIYEDEVQITYEVTVIVVRTAEPDGYSPTTNPGSLLCRFRTIWNLGPEASIPRDVAHLFTGRDLDDPTLGVAYNGVVCNEPNFVCEPSINNGAYSLAESRAPTLSTVERVAVTAHELGHNWSAIHCDDDAVCQIMCSQIGACGLITSFGPTAISDILDYKSSASCLTVTQDPIGEPSFFDNFQVIDPAKWTYNIGGVASPLGVGEPSPTRSLQLSSPGTGLYEEDEIRTNFINLDGQSDLTISYYTEHIGVEVGERLIVEYWTFNDKWQQINEIVSDGVDQGSFVFHEHDVPFAAYHENFRLRFRTDGDSESDKWYIDDVLIGDAVPTPPNDECTEAFEILDGVTPFTTIGATTDGLPLAASCDEGDGTQIENDIWYNYTPTCDGTVTVSTCSVTEFDIRLGVFFQSVCPSGSSVFACSDDAPGCGIGAEVTFDTFPGVSYVIRVGSADGSAGSGDITITCEPDGKGDPCPHDLDGDGSVGAADLATLLGAWGTSNDAADFDDDGTVGAADLATLLGSWGPCP